MLRAAASDGSARMAPGLARYVELFRARPPVDTLEATRLNSDLRAHLLEPDGAPRGRHFDTSVSLPGHDVPVRIHSPTQRRGEGAICYFHGGGFAFGSVAMLDVATARICELTGFPVVSANYRRLPDSDFEGTREDCRGVFEWMVRNANLIDCAADRTVLSGDSVGAFLALLTALEAPVGQGPSGLLLFYGAYAMGLADIDYEHTGDPLLTRDRIAATTTMFRDGGGAEMGSVFEHAAMSQLPPTHVVAAELDPLAADSRRLVSVLKSAGVAVTTQTAPGMIHGFVRACGTSPEAREQLQAACEALVKQQKRP
ncbi:alpha/beta hydrolase [Novosphingobium aquimarinum]|uniref:alpha/beta hydrolase n=1 Tax=Novosphingobium aquimarinum TaxID=2682494 RepID=UPI0012EC6266|nr:alpha/beta hydrolase fold domain-containing protein [Novosphingobium aquimarinum]